MEEKKNIKELDRQVFQNGPYLYQIKLRQANIGSDTLNSVTITITNLVNRVKGDIVMIVLQKLREYLKDTDELGLNAIYVEETDALGNYVPLLKIPHNAFNMQPLNDQLLEAAKYMNNVVDLEETLRIAGVRKTKVEKTLHHLQRSITQFQGHKVHIDNVEVKAKLLPSSKGLLPRLMMDVYVKLPEERVGLNRDLKDQLKSYIEAKFDEYCPIDIKKEDVLYITL